jgi:hypothetical protein
MGKLTLSVDDRVVSQAKKYPKARRISVSRLVETYLAAVPRSPADPVGDAPILCSLRGSLQHADLDAYWKHLTVKHR